MKNEENYWDVKAKIDWQGKTNKNKIFYKKFFLLTLILLILFNILFYLNNQKNENLTNFSKTDQAIVTDIFVRHVKVNDMDGTTILNYTISYEFYHKKDIIKGRQVVDRYFYDKYFDKKLKINDTIVILYNPNRPELNIIKKQSF